MLKLLQQELPKLWTDELYSEQFRASPSKYKDFDHALKHILKATTALICRTEEVDHSGNLLDFPIDDAKKYIADIVISAVRLALTNPNGEIDLEQAVLDRIERKMGVKLKDKEKGVFCLEHRRIMTNGTCPKCEKQVSYEELSAVVKKIPTSEIASWSGMTFDEATSFVKKLR